MWINGKPIKDREKSRGRSSRIPIGDRWQVILRMGNNDQVSEKTRGRNDRKRLSGTEKREVTWLTQTEGGGRVQKDNRDQSNRVRANASERDIGSSYRVRCTKVCPWKEPRDVVAVAHFRTPIPFPFSGKETEDTPGGKKKRCLTGPRCTGAGGERMTRKGRCRAQGRKHRVEQKDSRDETLADRSIDSTIGRLRTRGKGSREVGIGKTAESSVSGNQLGHLFASISRKKGRRKEGNEEKSKGRGSSLK